MLMMPLFCSDVKRERTLRKQSTSSWLINSWMNVLPYESNDSDWKLSLAPELTSRRTAGQFPAPAAAKRSAPASSVDLTLSVIIALSVGCRDVGFGEERDVTVVDNT